MDKAKKLEEALECPVCRDILKSPIYLCVTGHSFCLSCTNRLKKCPICRQVLTKCRNYTLEALAEEFIIPKTSDKPALRSWKYSQLQHGINSSKDTNLVIECCSETLRRLKIYNEWKRKFVNRLGTLQIYTQGIKDRDVDIPDRFFRMEISLKGDIKTQTGWWYLNFKEGSITKQIISHPQIAQINVIGDEFNEEMEKFDLGRKRWLEITENCFQSIWIKSTTKI